MTNPPPQTVGRYEVLGSLGSGGMAQVLLGRLRGSRGFERVVALKVLLPELVDVDGSLDMFLDEARIAASITHPNVAQVHELLHSETELCIVMEYLAGESVARLLSTLRKKGKTLPPALACHLIAEACAGVHAAHEHRDADGQPSGLVHRDISPQNLFVTYDGAVKVLDFGVARARGRITRTEAGLVKGKYEYMSPEQSVGAELDRRSDVFSIGVVLWEMLTGRSLFRRAQPFQVAQAIVEDPVLPPSRVVPGLPASLDAVCARALAVSPGDRFADAAQMRRELLTAGKALALEGPGDEALAKLMAELFSVERDRKEALLQQTRSGSSLPMSQVKTVPTKGRVRVAVIAAVGVLLIGGGALAWWLPKSVEPVVEAVAPAQVEITELPSVELPADTTTVRVHIETVPPGAELWLGSRRIGKSPMEVELARDSKPVRLSVRRPGAATVEQMVVPDRDQRVLLQLPGVRRKAGVKGEDPLQQKW